MNLISNNDSNKLNINIIVLLSESASLNVGITQESSSKTMKRKCFFIETSILDHLFNHCSQAVFATISILTKLPEFISV
jgi:hypothetical protein